MGTGNDLAGNRSLATSLEAASEELEDALRREDDAAVSGAERSAEGPIAVALNSGDDDLTEMAIYVLAFVRPEAGTAAFERALRDAGDNESQLERIRRAARLSGHDLQNVRERDAQTLATIALRLPWTSGTHYSPPAQPLATSLASITTIVHGTWANRSGNRSAWWETGGRFARRVAASVDDFYGEQDCFYWSGGNSDSDRKQAAGDLLQWFHQRLRAQGSIRLLCHSHGGNVALLAAQQGLRIKTLFLLGTPIRTDYLPRMDNVERIVSIFSPTDHVQTGGSLGRRRGEGRTLADTTQIMNLVTADPDTGHSDLHDWSVWTHPKNRFDQLL